MASNTTSVETGTDQWKENVRWNYKRLVQDTDLYMAVDECFSIGIFKEEERDEVQSEKIKHEKNRHFLNLLLHKSRSLFDKFMKSDFLNSEQNDHIRDLLDVANVQTTKPRTESDVETNLQRRKIFRSYERIIRTTTLRFVIDDFIAENVFDLEDYENIRKGVKNTHEENRRFLNILLTKNTGYQLLLNMLRETDHHELASQIEQENVDENDDEEIEEFLSRQKERDQHKGHGKNQQESERFTDALLPQRMSHVIETKLHVDSEFQHETDKGEITAIAIHDNQTAWIATFQGNKIKHVDQTGHVDKTLTFTTQISDIAVTEDRELLIVPNGGSGGHENQIKKVKPNNDIVTFVDMKPLRPNCICTSKTGHIYVECIDGVNYDVTDKNTRSVMKLSSTGIVQQSCQYDDKGQRLFTVPKKLQENINGDVWIYDRTASNKGRIVVIQQDGKLRFIYTGVKNDKITYDFNPGDITAAGNGNMLICDTNNCIVHVVDENGILLYFLGSQHKTGMYAPTSLSLDIKHNQLWVGNLKGQVQVLRLK